MGSPLFPLIHQSCRGDVLRTYLQIELREIMLPGGERSGQKLNVHLIECDL